LQIALICRAPDRSALRRTSIRPNALRHASSWRRRSSGSSSDADHASFGCADKAKWTYFGDAFFNVALRQTKSLKDTFLLARALILKRELRQGFDPSHPQMAGGGNVEPLLVARP
jgi:hypothetical protein